MHRRHRVPGVGQVPRAELGGQLAEPGRQHGGVLGGKLPRHPDLGQVTVRVRQRHAGFPRPSQAAQGHLPRRGIIATGQPGIQLGEQVLPPGQQRRRVSQPHRLPGDPPALLIHDLADSGPPTVGDHEPGADSGAPTVGDHRARADSDPSTIGDR